MDRIQFNPKLGGCPNSDHAKMRVFIGSCRVFRGSVDHGGVHIYIYIYIYVIMSASPLATTVCI